MEYILTRARDCAQTGQNMQPDPRRSCSCACAVSLRATSWTRRGPPRRLCRVHRCYRWQRSATQTLNTDTLLNTDAPLWPAGSAGAGSGPRRAKSCEGCRLAAVCSALWRWLAGGQPGTALSTAQCAPALARSLWSWLWLCGGLPLAGWLHTGSWLTVALARSLARWVSAGACNNSSTPVYPPFSLQNIGQKWV